MRKQQIEEVKSTRNFLQLADHSLKFSLGVVENLLVKVRTFIFLADFVIFDMEEDVNASIILRRPFLATGRALIDVQKCELTLRVNDEQIVLNVFKALQHPNDYADCMKIDITNPLVQEALEEEDFNESLESSIEVEVGEIEDYRPPKGASYIPSKDYNQIAVDPYDQEKTVFTCSFGVFAYHHMPFALCNAPVTFQSDVAIGAVLEKRQDEILHVIYYASRVLNDAQRNYTTTEKELLDVVLLLQEFDIEISDRKGSENQVVDHVSHIELVKAQEPPPPLHEEFPDEHLLAIHKTL
nr:uncharacterized protein LOC112709991 [Arachis hypogaea]